MLKKYGYTIALGGWLMLVTLFCLLPMTGVSTPGLYKIPHIDKIVHFSFYVVAAFLATRALTEISRVKHPSRKKSVQSACMLIVYGIVIEILQETVTHHRQADVFDVLANALGVMVGVLAARAFLKHRLPPN